MGETKTSATVTAGMSRMEKLSYHRRTVWLFTKSDLPTSTGINTTFALIGLIAGPTMLSHASSITLCSLSAFKALLVALYFTWHLTLCFNLGNQRQPQSAIEDGVNKPWRPIPAGRITAETTRTWQLVAVASLLALCATALGATGDISFYLFCTWLYNERAWGDKTWYQRALMNACGITTNRVATLRVAAAALLSEPVQFTPAARLWYWLCAAVVFTTIQVQDLRDQEGDAEIDRQTLPLILGDGASRWLTAVAVWFWSLAAPCYWRLGLLGYLMPVAVGGLVTAHMLVHRTRERDQTSFRLVAAWWVALYFLPVMKTYGL